MPRERHANHDERPPQEGEVIAIRKIESIADVVRELDLLHNKHVTKDSATEFFHRVGGALADLPATHSTSTSITLNIDNVEHEVKLQKTGGTFSLSVTKVLKHH